MTPTVDPGAPEAVTEELMTVEAANTLYDIGEQELWDEFAGNQSSFVAGRAYLHAERLLRTRRDRTIRSIRYKRFDPKPEPPRAVPLP